jgi:D-3-phosphoglycerate dehydrogenase
MDNVIVTPHIASATSRMMPETRRRLGQEIALVLQGRWPRSAVNPQALQNSNLVRWQPQPMSRGPNR